MVLKRNSLVKFLRVRHTESTLYVGTLYPQKLAITSPTSGGRSVGIVRSRTQDHGVCLLFFCLHTFRQEPLLLVAHFKIRSSTMLLILT
jgi:hypothetical protein